MNKFIALIIAALSISINTSAQMKQASSVSFVEMCNGEIHDWDHENAIINFNVSTQTLELKTDIFEAIDNRAFCKMDLGLWADAIEDFKLSFKHTFRLFLVRKSPPYRRIFEFTQDLPSMILNRLLKSFSKLSIAFFSTRLLI